MEQRPSSISRNWICSTSSKATFLSIAVSGSSNFISRLYLYLPSITMECWIGETSLRFSIQSIQLYSATVDRYDLSTLGHPEDRKCPAYNLLLEAFESLRNDRSTNVKSFLRFFGLPRQTYILETTQNKKKTNGQNTASYPLTIMVGFYEFINRNV